MTAALRAEGVAKRRGNFALLVPRFHVAAGEALAITGASGSGKSTLLDLLALALKPDAATAIQVGDTAAAPLWQRNATDALAKLRARTIDVLQQGGLLPFLSVHANIRLPQQLAGRHDPTRIAALADRLNITDQLRKKPGTLSVGQRQRAAIARALAHSPAIVLADEPTASVHPEMASTILDLLVETAHESGAALVLATHDPVRAEAAGFTMLALRTASEDGSLISVLERA